MNQDNKDIKVFKRILSLPSTLKEFIDSHFNLLVDDLNTYFSTLSLTRNFNSQIIRDVVIKPNEKTTVNHSLLTAPSYYLVVNQEGGSTIYGRNISETSIDLFNSGTSEAKITVILFKE